MQSAYTPGRSRATTWIERSIVACLVLLAITIPHSIAASQGVWLIALLLWVARFLFSPTPALHRTPLDYALLGFIVLTVISALLSYEPSISIGKLRGVGLFTVVYLVAQNLHSRRLIRLLVVILIASFSINVLYTAGERVVGRGARVGALSDDSPLRASGIRAGDILLQVDGRKLSNPEELLTALASAGGPVVVKGYRHELLPIFEIERGSLLNGSTAVERLGIQEWSKGRDWRASGFFGHYATYAEALQLVLAIIVGLVVSLPSRRGWIPVVLLLILTGFSYALLLTVTRASWLAFLVSSGIILGLSVRRRTALIVAGLAIPIVLAGLVVLKQKRNVGFLDRQDQSTTWRETVWREGFNVMISQPRHLLIGVGMDSIKERWRQWGMFDQGKLPMGHMHSNLLQFGFERGIPALVTWLLLMGLYARLLLRLRRRLAKPQSDDDVIDGGLHLGRWIERGLVLGALGGLVGFFLSGLVHYNWGDSEVVMIFYFITGLILALNRLLTDTPATSEHQL